LVFLGSSQVIPGYIQLYLDILGYFWFFSVNFRLFLAFMVISYYHLLSLNHTWAFGRTAARITALRNKGRGNKHHRDRDTAIL